MVSVITGLQTDFAKINRVLVLLSVKVSCLYTQTHIYRVRTHVLDSCSAVVLSVASQVIISDSSHCVLFLSV